MVFSVVIKCQGKWVIISHGQITDVKLSQSSKWKGSFLEGCMVSGDNGVGFGQEYDIVVVMIGVSNKHTRHGNLGKFPMS